MTAHELYQSQVKPLPVRERIKLATLILEGIPEAAVVDDGDEWTEEDLKQVVAASVSKALEEGADDAEGR